MLNILKILDKLVDMPQVDESLNSKFKDKVFALLDEVSTISREVDALSTSNTLQETSRPSFHDRDDDPSSDMELN